MAANQRQTLVDESDHAYDKAIALPVQKRTIEESRTYAMLEVLVAEARLARYDRENPNWKRRPTSEWDTLEWDDA